MPEINKNLFEFKDNGRDVEEFVGRKIYSTTNIEGIGGIYKYTYKDFIVKEIINSGVILEIKEDNTPIPFSRDSKDAFTTFNLVKINKDTLFEYDGLPGGNQTIFIGVIKNE